MIGVCGWGGQLGGAVEVGGWGVWLGWTVVVGGSTLTKSSHWMHVYDHGHIIMQTQWDGRIGATGDQTNL